MNFIVQSISPNVECPLTLEVTEIPRAPPGFATGSADKFHPLVNIRVFDGDPQKKVELAPTLQETQSGYVQQWDIEPYRSSVDPIIIRCEYEGTSAWLQQELRSAVGSLTVTLQRQIP